MKAGTPFRVLAAEGLRAAADRARDRLAEWRRRRSFASMEILESALGLPPAAFPVLLLSAAAPAPRLGGVQAALLARLDEEERRRPVALLYPLRGSWRLELSEGALRRAAELPGAAPPDPTALADAELERVVGWAVERCGAGALHVEGAAGLPLRSLARLGSEGLPLILALHDFALFCPRPHLLEEPARRFCHYSRDPARCAACLEATWPPPASPAPFQAKRRELGASLLAAAAAAVFPSDFLRRTHAELFPGAVPARSLVIPPARPPAPPLAPRRSPPGPPQPPRRVALLGGAQAHKGAEIFAEAVGRLAGAALAFTVYGGGDPAIFHRLRGLPAVAVRGYYRAGSLAGLLRRDRIDLALLLSIVPESYGLALSECRRAGVPVVAFDHGAVAERIRDEGGGLLVDLAEGAPGLAATIEALARGTVEIPPLRADVEADEACRTADRWLALYRDLGLV